MQQFEHFLDFFLFPKHLLLLVPYGIKYLLPLILGEVQPVYENGLPKHVII